MLSQGNCAASWFDAATIVSRAISTGTYSGGCSASIRMRVLTPAPLPNSMSCASGPTNCATSAMWLRMIVISVRVG